MAKRKNIPFRRKDERGGFNDNPDFHALGPAQFMAMKNFYRDKVGNLRSRSGYTRLTATGTGNKILSVGQLIKADGNEAYLFYSDTDKKFYRINASAGTVIGSVTFTDSDIRWLMLQQDDMCFLFSGNDTDGDYNWKIYLSSGTWYITSMGIAAPGSAPTFNVNVDGSMAAGDYQFMYTFRDSNSGTESNPSTASAAMTAAAHPNDGIRINIAVDANAADTGTNQRRIYRTAVGPGTIYKYDGDVSDNVTTVFNSTQADSGLGDPVEDDHYVMPASQFAVFARGKLWTARQSSPIVNISKGGQYEYQDTADSNATVTCGDGDGQKVAGLAELFDTPYVLKESSIYSVSAVTTTSWLVQKQNDAVGCLVARSLQKVTDFDRVQKLIFLGNEAIYEFNGVVPTPITHGVMEQRFARINRAALSEIISVVDTDKNHYIISVPLDAAPQPTERWVYDYIKKDWYIYQDDQAEPTAYYRAQDTTNKKYFVMAGDDDGYIRRYTDDSSTDSHWVSGKTYTGTATSAGGNDKLTDTGADFVQDGEDLKDSQIYIASGTGAGQERTILSNTATVITVTTNWATNPDNTSVYHIGPIDSLLRSKWFDFDLSGAKKLRSLEVSCDPQATAYNLLAEVYGARYRDNLANEAAAASVNFDMSNRHEEHMIAARGSFLNLRLSHRGAEQPIAIHEYVLNLQRAGKQ